MRKASLRSASAKSSVNGSAEDNSCQNGVSSKLGSSYLKPPALQPSRNNSRSSGGHHLRTRSVKQKAESAELSDQTVNKLKPPASYSVDHIDKRKESISQLNHILNTSFNDNKDIPPVKDRVTTKSKANHKSKPANPASIDASNQTEDSKKKQHLVRKKLGIAETNKEKQILLKKKTKESAEDSKIDDPNSAEDNEFSQDQFFLFPDDNSRTEHPSFTLLDTELANKIGECLHDSNISLYEDPNCDATSISEQLGHLPPSSCSMNLDENLNDTAANQGDAVEVAVDRDNRNVGNSLEAELVEFENKHVEVSAPADCELVVPDAHVVTVFQDEDASPKPLEKKAISSSSIILTEGNSPEGSGTEEFPSQAKDVEPPVTLKCSVEVDPSVKITDSAQVSISEGKSLSSKLSKPNRNVPIKPGTLKQPQMSSRPTATSSTNAASRMPAPPRNTPVATRLRTRQIPELKTPTNRANGQVPPKSFQTPAVPSRSRVPAPSTRTPAVTEVNDDKSIRKSSVVSSFPTTQRKNSASSLKSSKTTVSKTAPEVPRIERKRQKLTDQSTQISSQDSQIAEMKELVQNRTVELQSLQDHLHLFGRGFDAMSVVCQRLDHQRQVFASLSESRLQNVNTAVSKQEQINQELVSCQAERDKLIQELNTQTELNQLELTSLLQRHEEEIKEIKQKKEHGQEEKLSQVIHQHSEEIKTLRAYQDKKVREEKSHYETKLSELKAHYEDILFKRSKEHETKLMNLQELHGSEMESMNCKFESMKTSLSQKVMDLQSQCQNLELHSRSHDEYVQMMSDRQLQMIYPEMALAPYEKLPEEINSLKHVLELKTNEIVNLKAANTELREKLRGYDEKENELLQLQYKLENMEAIITLKTDAEKQLQDRYQAIFRRLDQEARDKRKLASEVDSLKYRLEEFEFYKSIREEKEREAQGVRHSLNNNNNVSSGSLNDLHMTSSVQMRPSSGASPRPMSTSSISQVVRPRQHRTIRHDRTKRLTLSSPRDLQQNP